MTYPIETIETNVVANDITPSWRTNKLITTAQEGLKRRGRTSMCD